MDAHGAEGHRFHALMVAPLLELQICRLIIGQLALLGQPLQAPDPDEVEVPVAIDQPWRERPVRELDRRDAVGTGHARARPGLDDSLAVDRDGSVPSSQRVVPILEKRGLKLRVWYLRSSSTAS